VLVASGLLYWAVYAAMAYAAFLWQRRAPAVVRVKPVTADLSAAACPARASSGETRRSFGVGGKVGTTNVELGTGN
jgi:hypothetical protein